MAYVITINVENEEDISCALDETKRLYEEGYYAGIFGEDSFEINEE